MAYVCDAIFRGGVWLKEAKMNINSDDGNKPVFVMATYKYFDESLVVNPEVMAMFKDVSWNYGSGPVQVETLLELRKIRELLEQVVEQMRFE